MNNLLAILLILFLVFCFINSGPDSGPKFKKNNEENNDSFWQWWR